MEVRWRNIRALAAGPTSPEACAAESRGALEEPEHVLRGLYVYKYVCLRYQILVMAMLVM